MDLSVFHVIPLYGGLEVNISKVQPPLLVVTCTPAGRRKDLNSQVTYFTITILLNIFIGIFS